MSFFFFALSPEGHFEVKEVIISQTHQTIFEKNKELLKVKYSTEIPSLEAESLQENYDLASFPELFSQR